MRRVFAGAAVFAVSLVFASNVLADDSLLLKWQLPQGARYTYDHSQEMTAEMEGKDIPPGAGESSISSEGPITIFCNGGTATVRLETHARKMVVGGHDITPDQMETATQSVEMPMDADGKITQGRYNAGGNTQLMLDMLFPLPQEPLDTLKSTSQDIVMFASGSTANLKGKAVFTFTGLKTVENMDCVAYHVTCKLKTEKKKGKHEKMSGDFSIVSDFDCVFARDRGFFVSVDGTSTVTMNLDVKDKENPVNMSMTQHHKTSLMLSAAEYNVAAEDPAPETLTDADIAEAGASAEK